jgi:hypothetical protein
MMANTIELNLDDLKLGSKLLKEITTFRPYSSISFQSSEEILSAAQEVKRLAKWGMAKNKHKMKASVIHTLDSILGSEPDEPVNLNLSKYELKSVRVLFKLVKRTLNQKKDGAVLV